MELFGSLEASASGRPALLPGEVEVTAPPLPFFLNPSPTRLARAVHARRVCAGAVHRQRP